MQQKIEPLDFQEESLSC
jgi:hypothetical protein